MSQKDQQILKNAIAQKLLTVEQARQLVSAQRNYADKGYNVTLLQIALKYGFLTVDQISNLQMQLQTVVQTVQPTPPPLPPKQSPIKTVTPEVSQEAPPSPEDQTINLNTSDKIFFSDDSKYQSIEETVNLKTSDKLFFSSEETINETPETVNLDTSDKLFFSNDETLNQPPETINFDTSEPETLSQESDIYANSSQTHLKRIGRYEVVKELGHGNMGKVYLVKDPTLDRLLALKVLLFAGMAKSKDAERFIREAKSTAKLQHPNIIKIHDIGKDGDTNFFTMDYIQGAPLDELIKKKKLGSRKVASLMITVCNAMNHAHQQGIIHRDLKPGNIMITKDGIPIVMDFGLARAIKEKSKLSQTGSIMGTPVYMPPEQARGQVRSLDARTDIYSLGATLYELITHQPPFIGNEVMSILMKVINSAPILPREVNRLVPQDLESICLKAMEKNKKDRYQTASAMAKDLQHFLDGVAIQAQPPKFSMKKWLTQHKVSVISSVTIIIIIIGFSLMMNILQSMKNQNLEIEKKNIEIREKRLEREKEKLGDAIEKLQKDSKLLQNEKEILKRKNKLYSILLSLEQEKLPATLKTHSQIDVLVKKRDLELKKLKQNIARIDKKQVQEIKSIIARQYYIYAKSYIILSKYSTTIGHRNILLKKSLVNFEKSSSTDPTQRDSLLEIFSLVYLHLNIPGKNEYRKNFFKNMAKEEPYLTFYKGYLLTLDAMLNNSPKKHVEAIKLFNTLQKNTFKKFAPLYLELGKNYRRLKKFKKAELNFRKAIKIRANLAYAYIEMGENFIDWAKNSLNNKKIYLREAIFSYEIALEYDNFSYESHFYKALSQMYLANLGENRLQNYSLAIEGFYRAMQYGFPKKSCNKKLYKVYANRAQIYNNLKNYKKALKDYKKAITLCNSFEKELYKASIKSIKKKIKEK